MANEAYIRILSCIRANQGCSVHALDRSLPRHPKAGPAHPSLAPILDLMGLGLIQAQDTNGKRIPPRNLTDNHLSKARFYLSPKAVQIEDALDISLGGKFHSIFGTPKYTQRPLGIFVMMPFAPVYRPIYDAGILPVAQKLKTSCKRADDFTTTGSIIATIWSAINQAEIIIGECTGKNPNVFYEIGIAHALGKPTVLIAQTEQDIPFDLKHLKVIIYDISTEPGLDQFKEDLANTIKSLRTKGN
jgi:hypothetical protein